MEPVTKVETPEYRRYPVSWTLHVGNTVCLSEATTEGWERGIDVRGQVMDEARMLATRLRATVRVVDHSGALMLARVQPDRTADGPGDDLGCGPEESRKTVPVPAGPPPGPQQAIAGRLRRLAEDVCSGRVDPELVSEFLSGVGR